MSWKYPGYQNSGIRSPNSSSSSTIPPMWSWWGWEATTSAIGSSSPGWAGCRETSWAASRARSSRGTFLTRAASTTTIRRRVPGTVGSRRTCASPSPTLHRKYTRASGRLRISWRKSCPASSLPAGIWLAAPISHVRQRDRACHPLRPASLGGFLNLARTLATSGPLSHLRCGGHRPGQRELGHRPRPTRDVQHVLPATQPAGIPPHQERIAHPKRPLHLPLLGAVAINQRQQGSGRIRATPASEILKRQAPITIHLGPGRHHQPDPLLNDLIDHDIPIAGAWRHRHPLAAGIVGGRDPPPPGRAERLIRPLHSLWTHARPACARHPAASRNPTQGAVAQPALHAAKTEEVALISSRPWPEEGEPADARQPGRLGAFALILARRCRWTNR
jgi:hypothetical protein